jgi:hypothetical protein
MLGSSSVAAQLAASQEGLSSKSERISVKFRDSNTDCSFMNLLRSIQILQFQVAMLEAIARNDQPEEPSHF